MAVTLPPAIDTLASTTEKLRSLIRSPNVNMSWQKRARQQTVPCTWRDDDSVSSSTPNKTFDKHTAFAGRDSISPCCIATPLQFKEFDKQGWLSHGSTQNYLPHLWFEATQGKEQRKELVPERQEQMSCLRDPVWPNCQYWTEGQTLPWVGLHGLHKV